MVGRDFEKQSFEEAIDELEAIVKAIESGDVSLDEALAKFERGITLTRLCNSKLSEAEKRINILIKGEDGNVVIKPAELAEEKNG